MRSGTLKHFAAIEVPVKTKTSTGAVSTVWTLYRSVWISIEFLNGFEKQSADAAWPGANTKIKFHYLAGVLPTMRLVFENVIYSILNVNDVELRHREIELTCKSGVSAI